MKISIRLAIFTLLINMLIVLFALWLAQYYGNLPTWNWLVFTGVVWAVVGFLTRKFSYKRMKNRAIAYNSLLFTDIVLTISLFFVYKFFHPEYRFNVSLVVTMLNIFFLEAMLLYFTRLFIYYKIPYYYEEEELVRTERATEKSGDDQSLGEVGRMIEMLQGGELDPDAITEERLLKPNAIYNTSQPNDLLKNSESEKLNFILHKKEINSVMYINKLFANSNSLLQDGGYMMCHCVTARIRDEYIMKHAPNGVNRVIRLTDNIVHRVFPRICLLKNIYFFFSGGRRCVFTRVEFLGRLYRSGFEVVHEQVINNLFYVIVRKIAPPITQDQPSTNFFIRLKRKGKDGKLIGVYKFRTMYSYSEYLQPYMYKIGGLAEGGKFADDYRVTPLGRFLRKTWLDELPMFINLIKGNMKFVGVRPLSNHYFSLYSKEVQKLRMKVKPGLLPPYYADMPKTLEEIEASEENTSGSVFTT